MQSGDVLTNKKWKQYYDPDEEGEPQYQQTFWKDGGQSKDTTYYSPNERCFKTGSVIGMLIN
jgi:hypothetical protein